MKPFTARPACQFWNKRWNLDEVGEKGVDKISDIYFTFTITCTFLINICISHFLSKLKINIYLYHFMSFHQLIDLLLIIFILDQGYDVVHGL